MKSLSPKESWTDVNKTWGEFRMDESESEPLVGLLIEVRHLRTDRSPAYTDRLLIGDINDMGGVCDDCCVLRRTDLVLRKRRVLAEND